MISADQPRATGKAKQETTDSLHRGQRTRSASSDSRLDNWRNWPDHVFEEHGDIPQESRACSLHSQGYSWAAEPIADEGQRQAVGAAMPMSHVPWDANQYMQNDGDPPTKMSSARLKETRE